MEVKQVGNLTENAKRENPQRRRVYDADGLSPTLTESMGMGGNLQPFIIDEVKQIGNIVDGSSWDNPQAGRIYDTDGCCPTINTCQGGQREPKIICAMRGRNPDNPSDRTAGSPTEQRLEPNSQGICNTLTSVQKDNMVLENICINDRGFSEKEPQVSIGTAPTLRAETHGNLPKVIESQYRIRKLTPLEVWRLMDFSDEDFHKAESVNSNSQLYKQAGNSIVKNVLVAIFGQMIPGKEKVYMESEV